MQDIMPPVAAGMQLIQSYGATGFRIGHSMFTQAVLVTPHQSFEWSGELTTDSLEPLFNVAPPIEVLILGTGLHHTLVPQPLRAALRAYGITVDSMNTGAACRTYNILLAEGRRAAAALMLPR